MNLRLLRRNAVILAGALIVFGVWKGPRVDPKEALFFTLGCITGLWIHRAFFDREDES